MLLVALLYLMLALESAQLIACKSWIQVEMIIDLFVRFTVVRCSIE